MNKRDAVREWVRGFNAVPLSVVEKLFVASDYTDMLEVTPRTDEEDYYDDVFPMWGTMWQPGDALPDWWIEKNLEGLASCGFRVYESEDFGYLLGIDGAGYSFFDEHWIPLYDLAGMHWHDDTDD